MKEVIINYILTACLGAALTVVFGLIKKLKDKTKTKIINNKTEDEAVKNAVKVMLRNEIKSQCKFYLAQQGISEDDFEELEEEIKIYEALGGNGMIHKYWALVQELRIN